jgi:hypothetical protein
MCASVPHLLHADQHVGRADRGDGDLAPRESGPRLRLSERDHRFGDGGRARLNGSHPGFLRVAVPKITLAPAISTSAARR